MDILLDQEKKYFKANLHCHSTCSDGRATAEDIKREYMKRGYSIVAYTDHNRVVDHSDLDEEGFLTIPSVELPFLEGEWTITARSLHINFYAKDKSNLVTPFSDAEHDESCHEWLRDSVIYDGCYKRDYDIDAVNAVIREAHERGYLVSYNHPNWSLESAERYMGYEGFDFLEIHNTGATVSGHVGDERVFEDMLLGGKRIFCTATDDNHNIHGFEGARSDSFGGFVMINASRLEYGEIMSALERGDFYASNGGPAIYSLVRDGDTVEITTAEATRIVMRTGSRRCRAKASEDGKPLTRAKFKLDPGYRYFRIRVEDERGKCSFTQAYPI